MAPSDSIQGFKPFNIEIYRGIYFDYTKETPIKPTNIENICGCSCGTIPNSCSEIDNIFIYSKPTDPIGQQYNLAKNNNFTFINDYFTEGEANIIKDIKTFDDSKIGDDVGTMIEKYDTAEKNFKKNIPETIYDLYKIDTSPNVYDDSNYITAKSQPKTYSPECQVCIKTNAFINGGPVSNFFAYDVSGTGVQLQKTFKISGEWLAPGFIHDNADLFEAFHSEYNNKKSTYSTQLQNLINTIQEQQTIFQANSNQILALQNRINVAKSLLEAQAEKLKTFSHQFNTFKAQNKQRNKNSVALKLPYMSPFYTMTAKQYLLMMIGLVITMIIIILVYGFYTTTRLVGDVSNSSSQNTSPTTNPFVNNQ